MTIVEREVETSVAGIVEGLPVPQLSTLHIRFLKHQLSRQGPKEDGACQFLCIRTPVSSNERVGCGGMAMVTLGELSAFDRGSGGGERESGDDRSRQSEV
jgi:hypothetical protein